MSVKQFPHLFEPLKVRGTTFKNRIFSAPQGYYNVGPQAHPNADMIAYFEAKAQGGIASVCIGDAIVHSPTGNKGSVPHLDDPSCRVHMAYLANAINRHGAVATVELNHAGMYSRAVVNEGRPLYGPSAMAPTDYHPWEVEEMPEDVIIEIIESFGKSAAFVKSLGYGMVTIHGGHGWLVHQFMSERLNHRTDKWGGSLENRMRFPIAVADSIRRHAGPNFPIEFRMSGSEWAMANDGNGYDIDEGVRFAKALDGHVDIIHVSAGTHENVASVCISHPSIFLEAGVNSKYAAEIKKHVNCLVATVGSFSDPQHMEEFIAAGHADIVEIARQSLADPQIATKARTGHADEVTQCIRCMQCYRTGTKLGSHYCSVNPMTSRERTLAMAPAVKEKKKVLVAGGGIAGMQAALTAAKRGHEVILCEKGDRLGGVLLCEENVPFKKFMHDYIEHQKLMISRSKIDVRLNTEVTPDYAKTLEPDAIIAAIGGRPIVPPIEGINGSNVMSCEEAYANPEKGFPLYVPESSSAGINVGQIFYAFSDKGAI
ncbi:MAG: FAD-dependent oxidoreductase, partial [Oscillospiraceae bacterium]|nr:FAD-dependent oxidoreductase [Oscillospiraceae bacterium]